VRITASHDTNPFKKSFEHLGNIPEVFFKISGLLANINQLLSAQFFVCLVGWCSPGHLPSSPPGPSLGVCSAFPSAAVPLAFAVAVWASLPGFVSFAFLCLCFVVVGAAALSFFPLPASGICLGLHPPPC
jgi:hypothetical protein